MIGKENEGKVKAQGGSNQGAGEPTSLSVTTTGGGAIQNKTSTYNIPSEALNPVDPFPFARGALDTYKKFANQVSQFGTAPMHEKARQKQAVSAMDKSQSDDKDDDELPIGPGFSYMTHLFKRSGAKEKIEKKNKEDVLNGANVFTNSMAAIKTAMQMIGVYSDQNSGGLPFKLEDAYKIYHGDNKLEDHVKSQFHADIQSGINKMDPKKIRRFVNQDGSLTWEVLNDDKTVQSRFTMGEYNGANIFAQGGYSAFSQLLKQAKSQLGRDNKAEFDAIRGSYK